MNFQNQISEKQVGYLSYRLRNYLTDQFRDNVNYKLADFCTWLNRNVSKTQASEWIAKLKHTELNQFGSKEETGRFDQEVIKQIEQAGFSGKFK